MKIDKNKLIDLLVEKTDMGSEEIRDQLDKLIERILDAAKRGKALEIKEFGLFYFDEEGELSFDPADELSTEISFKYAGMKPVELKPERDTSISEPEENVGDEGDMDVFEDWEDEFENEPEQPEFSTSDEDDESIDDSLYDPFAPEETEPLEELPKEPSKTSPQDIKPVSSRRPVRKRKDNTGIFILIGIIIVAVLIGGYFYYMGTGSQNLDEQRETPAQTNPDPDTEQEEAMASNDPLITDTQTENDGQDQQVMEEAQPPMEQESPDQVSEETTTPNSGISVSETDQPLYGLTGTVVEQANNGYSIVLHSFTDADRAMTAAERLREEGYRVIVTPRTVYENTVWRVSVGQFETLGNAQQATVRLPTPYNTQNFIQRIRTN